MIRRYPRVKEVDAVLIGDMHLVLKEPLPKDVKGIDELLVRIRLAPQTKPDIPTTETIFKA